MAPLPVPKPWRWCGPAWLAVGLTFPVLSGGGVSEEGCGAGGEDCPGAARLHQPQGGEADGDDGGLRCHTLRRAAADGETSQGD